MKNVSIADLQEILFEKITDEKEEKQRIEIKKQEDEYHVDKLKMEMRYKDGSMVKHLDKDCLYKSIVRTIASDNDLNDFDTCDHLKEQIRCSQNVTDFVQKMMPDERSFLFASIYERQGTGSSIFDDDFFDCDDMEDLIYILRNYEMSAISMEE